MYRGTFNTGTASHSRDQRKWHVSQISKKTLDAIHARLRQTIRRRGWRLSYHLQKKENLTFSLEIVQHVINTGGIIEYNETPRRGRTSRRVLLRDPRDIHKVSTNLGLTDSNLCVVIDIDYGDVIIAYWNDADDDHKSIDMHKYENVPLKFV